jgi:hypothetical protein
VEFNTRILFDCARDDRNSGGDSSLACHAGVTCPEAPSIATSPAIGLVHGKQALQEGGALGSSQMGGEDSFTGAGETAQTFTFFVSLPPPSYWIGLGRPPPAPDWQLRFDNDVGRSRPPPKPNWCNKVWPLPILVCRTHPSIDLDRQPYVHSHATLPVIPPLSTLGNLPSILPTYHLGSFQPSIFAQRICMGGFYFSNFFLEAHWFIVFLDIDWFKGILLPFSRSFERLVL